MCDISEKFPDDIGVYAKQYIDTLPEESRASDEEYSRRIGICDGCDKLEEGLCRACGCFVELRAAVKYRNCPYDYWER